MNIKPASWNITEGLIVPKWKNLFKSVGFMIPFWANQKLPIAYVPKTGKWVVPTEPDVGGIIEVGYHGPRYRIANQTDSLLYTLGDVDDLMNMSTGTGFTLVSLLYGSQSQDGIVSLGESSVNNSQIIIGTSGSGPYPAIVSRAPSLVTTGTDTTLNYNSVRGNLVAAVSKKGNTGAEIWVDGIFYGENSTQTTYSSGTLACRVGGEIQRGASNSAGNGSWITLVYGFDKILTESEHKMLAEDPFGLFRRNDRIIGSAPKTVYAGSGRPGA